MSARAQTSRTSVRAPSHSMPGSCAHARSCSREMEDGFSGSGSPTRSRRCATPRLRSKREAATRSAIPLIAIMRETTATVGTESAGAGSGTKRAVSIPEPRIVRIGARRTKPRSCRRVRSSSF